MDTVNISKAIIICNTFHFFFSAAKACLLPFLPLFLRMIGLSAIETGIVIAAKTLTGFVWAPLWARCAIAYNKRRTVLMFSVFILAATYLSVTVVYNKVTDTPLACNNVAPMVNSTKHNTTHFPLHQTYPNVPTTEIPSADQTPSTVLATSPVPTEPVVSATISVPTSSAISTQTLPNSTSAILTNFSSVAINRTANTTSKRTTRSLSGDNSKGTIKMQKLTTAEPVAKTRESADLAETLALLHQMLEKDHVSVKEIHEMLLSPADMYRILKKYDPHTIFTKEDVAQMWSLLRSESGDGGKTATAVKSKRSNKQVKIVPVLREVGWWMKERYRTKRDEGAIPSQPGSKQRRSVDLHGSWTALKDKMKTFVGGIKDRKMEMFLVALIIVVFGEFLSSPVEKVADDAWFDFLERIDDLEKYGKQRLSGTIAFIMFPVIVTLFVDYTDCILPFNIHHFLIHFYLFAAFLGVAFIVAFFYPVPPPRKQKYKSKVGKGMRIVCCDCSSLLYVITLLIMGMVFASFSVFLFWLIQDKGGHELTMGLCVTIGAFSEIPMLLFSGKMVKKIGNAGVVGVALLALSLRLLYYSFLWTPWAVLPAELTHAFTHTAMWYAVLSYDEFNVGPAVDRSIRSILSSFYFGVGFSAGSLISGVVYEKFGSSVLFWAGSALSGAWCFLFLLIQKCLPKKERIKYVKLLRSGDETDDSDAVADDWLELALKEQ